MSYSAMKKGPTPEPYGGEIGKIEAADGGTVFLG